MLYFDVFVLLDEIRSWSVHQLMGSFSCSFSSFSR